MRLPDAAAPTAGGAHGVGPSVVEVLAVEDGHAGVASCADGEVVDDAVGEPLGSAPAGGGCAGHEADVSGPGEVADHDAAAVVDAGGPEREGVGRQALCGSPRRAGGWPIGHPETRVAFVAVPECYCCTGCVDVQFGAKDFADICNVWRRRPGSSRWAVGEREVVVLSALAVLQEQVPEEQGGEGAGVVDTQVVVGLGEHRRHARPGRDRLGMGWAGHCLRVVGCSGQARGADGSGVVGPVAVRECRGPCAVHDEVSHVAEPGIDQCPSFVDGPRARWLGAACSRHRRGRSVRCNHDPGRRHV